MGYTFHLLNVDLKTTTLNQACQENLGKPNLVIIK